jgi:capsular exopolysaccharide synthesis family protein
MTHLFEFLRKPNGQTGDSSLTSIETAWENIEMDAEFQHALPPQGVGSPEDKDNPSELTGIPAEEVQVQPASRIVYYGDPGSPGADRFRFLRMRLRELRGHTKVKSLLITSPLPNDGKSTIALNLATALAQRGKYKVLLIEGDLHHSCLTPRLMLKAQAGLAECLEGALDPLSAIRRLEPLGWYLLAAGKPRRNPTELLQTEAFSSLMQKLSPCFDWILLDSPPVLPLTDALLLKQQTDASLLVARAGRTPSDAVEEAIALLGKKHVLSIVLNCAERLGRLYSGYYYSPYYSRGRRTQWTEGKGISSRLQSSPDIEPPIHGDSN